MLQQELLQRSGQQVADCASPDVSQTLSLFLRWWLWPFASFVRRISSAQNRCLLSHTHKSCWSMLQTRRWRRR